MIEESQLNFDSIPNPKCPFKEYLEPNDSHCMNNFNKGSYEVLSEDSPELALWLSRIGGPDLGNIVPLKRTPNIVLPKFIPVISPRSAKILNGEEIEWVGVSLNKIYNYYANGCNRNIRDILGIREGTKIALFNYGKDKKIEEIWGNTEQFYQWVYEQKFDLVTGINYSIWDSQPHGERLINLKRNLITFNEMQKYNIPVIPHIYWYGLKDINRLAVWLHANPNVEMIAINVQTVKKKAEWERFLEQLRIFQMEAPSSLGFIISGPCSIERIYAIMEILPNVTFSNSYCFLISWLNKGLVLTDGKLVPTYTVGQKSKIFIHNIQIFKDIISRSPSMLQ